MPGLLGRSCAWQGWGAARAWQSLGICGGMGQVLAERLAGLQSRPPQELPLQYRALLCSAVDKGQAAAGRQG